MKIKIHRPVAGMPPSLSAQVGAWQRLAWSSTAIIVVGSLYALYGWWRGVAGDGRLIAPCVVAVTAIGLEIFVFLRFRPLVQKQLRSESQMFVESVFHWWGLLLAVSIQIRPQQDWNSIENLMAYVIAVGFLLFAARRVSGDRAQRIETAALEASREKAELERQLAEAKLAALSAQIEPHFLFNTLASIQYLVRNDAKKAGEMTSDLIRYLRLALPRMRQTTARLSDELELVRAYLGVMKIRMGERLTFSIDSPAELGDLHIPTMTLITLVENAIKHGLEQKPDGGIINLLVIREPQGLRLEVADTGGGFSTATSGTGIGLANIRERLNTLYGSRARLDLEANQPSGVKAILTLPIEKK